MRALAFQYKLARELYGMANAWLAATSSKFKKPAIVALGSSSKLATQLLVNAQGESVSASPMYHAILKNNAHSLVKATPVAIHLHT